MPGPSSPTRKSKVQIAKGKERARYLTDAEIAWWDQYGGKGGDFDLHLKAQGSHDGAANWVRGKFISEWWPKFYPDLDVPEIDKLYYCGRMGISRQIYYHLHNPLRDQKDEPGQTGSSSMRTTSRILRAPKLKKKAIPHDHWRRSNLGIYKVAVDKYTSKFSEPSWGRKRDISHKVYKAECNDSEQAEWKKKAQEAVKAKREAAKITDPKAHAEFIQQLFRELREQLVDLEDLVGVKICAMILHKTADGKYKISRELSTGIKEFGKSPALSSAMGAFQKWYQDTASTSVENPIPLPTVYPDYANGQYPLLPNFTGIGLDPARHLL